MGLCIQIPSSSYKINKWLKNIPASEENTNECTRALQQKLYRTGQGDQKFSFLLSIVNNSLLMFGIISHITGIKTRSEINQGWDETLELFHQEV